MKYNNNIKKNKIYLLLHEFFSPSYLKAHESKFRTFTEITWIIMGAFLAFIGIQFFIKNIFFNSGVTGISLIISQMIFNISSKNTGVNNSQTILYLLLFVINIPLFVFGWFKLNKRITIYGIIFTLSITILGLTLGSYSNTHPWIFKTIHNIRTAIMGSGGKAEPELYIESLFISVMGAVIFASGVVLSYRSRGCSGGTDFPVIYYSSKKQHGIGHYTIMINIGILMFGIMTLYWTDPLKTKNNYTFLQYITSYKIIGSVLYLIVYGLVIDFSFPRSRKISVFIITKKEKEIIKKCKEDKFIHTFTSIDVIGMYKNSSNKCLIGVMNYYDYIYVISTIKKVDSSAFVFTHNTNNVFGKFNSKLDLF